MEEEWWDATNDDEPRQKFVLISSFPQRLRRSPNENAADRFCLLWLAIPLVSSVVTASFNAPVTMESMPNVTMFE